MQRRLRVTAAVAWERAQGRHRADWASWWGRYDWRALDVQAAARLEVAAALLREHDALLRLLIEGQRALDSMKDAMADTDALASEVLWWICFVRARLLPPTFG